MKYLFLVQGEGRGHLTQAIALFELLNSNGHEICEVYVGISKHRKIPVFFYKKITSEIIPIQSPNFYHDSANKGILIFKSLILNFIKAPVYIKNIKKIKQSITKHKPDYFINFCDLHGGLLYLFHRINLPHFCIGHQYFFSHPSYNYPTKKRPIQYILLKIHTKITSIKASKKLALSFYEVKNIPLKKLIVMPPLLRKSILDAEIKVEDFITGYILNAGYAETIISWHKNNPNIKLHVFWDQEAKEKIDENLIFYPIDDIEFIKSIRYCKAYLSTSGFESICEAMYLEKPVLLNPVKNHYEQECNAFDALKTGAVIIDNQFNISTLIEFIPNYIKNTSFKKWVEQANSKFLEILTY